MLTNGDTDRLGISTRIQRILRALTTAGARNEPISSL